MCCTVVIGANGTTLIYAERYVDFAGTIQVSELFLTGKSALLHMQWSSGRQNDMTWAICDACGKSGETDNDDGGLFIRRYRARGVRIEYVCSNCVDAESTSIPYGDDWEERRIRESEK
jgi:hypothetical protein